MKRHIVLFVLAMILGGAVVVGTGVPETDVATAARGEPGPPPGKGGGGEVPDYGDLIIVLRDANGVPIPSDPVEVTNPETGEPEMGGLCWQPIWDIGPIPRLPPRCRGSTSSWAVTRTRRLKSVETA